MGTVNKPYYKKWCIARVVMRFPKLKGCVETETKKRMILPGERFKPLNNNLQFTFLGYDDPLFEIDSKQ